MRGEVEEYCRNTIAFQAVLLLLISDAFLLFLYIT